MSDANDNGAPTWQQERFEQSYPNADAQADAQAAPAEQPSEEPSA